MKIMIKTWRGERTCELSDALTPCLDAYEASGQLERADALARKTAEAYGRLVAKLVENDIITLEEATEVAGCSDEIAVII